MYTSVIYRVCSTFLIHYNIIGRYCNVDRRNLMILNTNLSIYISCTYYIHMYHHCVLTLIKKIKKKMRSRCLLFILIGRRGCDRLFFHPVVTPRGPPSDAVDRSLSYGWNKQQQIRPEKQSTTLFLQYTLIQTRTRQYYYYYAFVKRKQNKQNAIAYWFLYVPCSTCYYKTHS